MPIILIFLLLLIPPAPKIEAITSPHPIITGVPTFKLVNLDAFLVTYPPNSFDFFISWKKFKIFSA